MRYRRVNVEGLEVFFREAGSADAPTLLLLHGFPSSSHMFRDLIPLVEDTFHVVAPDLPGFGYSESPPLDSFEYTFDRLTEIVQGLVEQLGLERYALYAFDYGAPVGFRLARAHPERISGLIVQNGNAYLEGLSEATEPLQAYWRDRQAGEEAMRDLLGVGLTRFQYEAGVEQTDSLAPDAWTLDQHFLDLPGRDEAMLELLYDYRTNVESYPAWQAYLRENRPPLLIVWGEGDPFFLVAGAEAYRRDQPDAKLHLFPTGHFALESHAPEIAELVRGFAASLSNVSSEGRT